MEHNYYYINELTRRISNSNNRHFSYIEQAALDIQ